MFSTYPHRPAHAPPPNPLLPNLKVRYWNDAIFFQSKTHFFSRARFTFIGESYLSTLLKYLI